MPILLAFSFLTRLPIPVRREIKERELASASAYFPLVGLVLAGGAAVIFKILTPFFPLAVNILLVLVFLAIITGGLHLDGFMDTLDGLGCGGDKEKTLSVMKDSRVGAYGAAGISFLVLFKFIVLFELTQAGAAFFPMFAAMLVVSRWSMVTALYKSKYPRSQGLGRAFVEYVSVREVAVSSLITITAMYFLSYDYLYTLPLFIIYVLLIKRFFTKKLGGITGDTLGFINEVAEVLFLLVAFFGPI